MIGAAACAPVEQLLVEVGTDLGGVAEVRASVRSAGRLEEQTFPISSGEILSFGVLPPEDLASGLRIELEARSATASVHAVDVDLERFPIGRGFLFLAEACRRPDAPACEGGLACGPCGACDPFLGEARPRSWSMCDPAPDAGTPDASKPDASVEADASEPDAEEAPDAGEPDAGASDAGDAEPPDRGPSQDGDGAFDGSVPDRGPLPDASSLSAGREDATPARDAGPKDGSLDPNGRTFGDAEPRDSEAYDGALDDGRDV
jgi:hypothetical protein